jgi:hypothetical protein
MFTGVRLRRVADEVESERERTARGTQQMYARNERVFEILRAKGFR